MASDLSSSRAETLLVCGVCGGGFALRSEDRCACANHPTAGPCENSRTIKRQAVEARVPAGLKEKLLAPEFLAAWRRAGTKRRPGRPAGARSPGPSGRSPRS